MEVRPLAVGDLAQNTLAASVAVRDQAPGTESGLELLQRVDFLALFGPHLRVHANGAKGVWSRIDEVSVVKIFGPIDRLI